MKKLLSYLLMVLLILLPMNAFAEEYPVGIWTFSGAINAVGFITVMEDGTVYSAFVPYAGEIQTVQQNYNECGLYTYSKASDTLVMKEGIKLQRFTTFAPDLNGDAIAGLWVLSQSGVISSAAYDGAGNYVTHIFTTQQNLITNGAEGTYEVEEASGYYSLTLTDITGNVTETNFSIMDKFLTMMPSDGSGALVFQRIMGE